MAKKIKRIPPATLSDACLVIREFLWDGSCPYAAVFPNQEMAICQAASVAVRKDAITIAQMQKITDVIMDRIHPSVTVLGYLVRVHGVMLEEVGALLPKIQEYRHAWLVHLSEEFKNESAT